MVSNKTDTENIENGWVCKVVHHDVKQKREMISSLLLSLSSRTNILLVHSSAVSGLGLVKAAAKLIL